MINLEEFTKEYEKQMQRKITSVTIRPKMVARKCSCKKCKTIGRKVMR